MDLDKKNKVLLLIGMEHSLEPIKKKFHRENMIILQSYRPFISHPFDDLMRDILAAVYTEQVEEIIVVASKESQKKRENLYSKIIETKGKESLETLDYLFKNSIPEFPGTNIREWVEGGKSAVEDVQNTINIIQHHPLMPQNIKVNEIYMEKNEGTRL